MQEVVDNVDEVSQRRSAAMGTAQDDVERLIELAGQLCSAIERQIHNIEEELEIVTGESRPIAQTVFKERLIHSAESLNTTLHEIALNLERRAFEPNSRGDIRDSWSA